MATRVGVILCGCGRFDGSEVHEATLTLLHLARAGARAECFAPDGEQWAVCDHFTGDPVEGERRNMLAEAARIARGAVRPLDEARATDLDALILPGGSGAARNLCDFAERGADATVIPVLHELIVAMHAAGKPIGAICIAPAIVALALRGGGVRLTLGEADGDLARRVAPTGAHCVDCRVQDVVVDERHAVISTPAYVLAQDVAEADAGIGKLVAAVLERAGKPVRG